MLEAATVYRKGNAEWVFNGWWSSQDMAVLAPVVQAHVDSLKPSFWSLCSVPGPQPGTHGYSALNEMGAPKMFFSQTVQEFAETLRDVLMTGIFPLPA